MKQKIIINFIELPKKWKISYYYKDAFYDLYKNFGIKVYCFITGKNIDLKELNNTFQKDNQESYDFWKI